MTKKKYFSLEQKLEILDEAKNSSLNKAAKIYQISVKTIRTWKLKLEYWSPVNKIDNLNRDFFVLCHD